MRRLFIQFYLLLIGCFTLAILLVGLVYQVSAERAGDRYLERMMQGSLGLLTGELARLPPERWPVRMAEQSRQLTLPLQIGALANQPLAKEDQAFIEAGNIVIVEGDDTFLQRIPGTDQVLIVGPVPYLSYLHELHWVDVGLLLAIGLSLGLPILLWLRPHWRGLQRLEQTARRVGDGDLSSRTGLPPGSSLGRVGRTFDQMTEQLQAMLASRMPSPTSCAPRWSGCATGSLCWTRNHRQRNNRGWSAIWGHWTPSSRRCSPTPGWIVPSCRCNAASWSWQAGPAAAYRTGRRCGQKNDSTWCVPPIPCPGAAIPACWIGRWRTSSATPCATPPAG